MDPIDYYMFTDGAFSGGDGSCGFVLYNKDREEILKSSVVREDTTSQRMELSAGIYALHTISKMPELNNISIISDSQYLVKGINNWMASWIANNWTKNGVEVKNSDLWKTIKGFLDKLKDRNFEFVWVKGHSGITGNEAVDELCVSTLQTFLEQKRKKLNLW